MTKPPPYSFPPTRPDSLPPTPFNRRFTASLAPPALAVEPRRSLPTLTSHASHIPAQEPKLEEFSEILFSASGQIYEQVCFHQALLPPTLVAPRAATRPNAKGNLRRTQSAGGYKLPLTTADKNRRKQNAKDALLGSAPNFGRVKSKADLPRDARGRLSFGPDAERLALGWPASVKKQTQAAVDCQIVQPPLRKQVGPPPVRLFSVPSGARSRSPTERELSATQPTASRKCFTPSPESPTERQLQLKPEPEIVRLVAPPPRAPSRPMTVCPPAHVPPGPCTSRPVSRGTVSELIAQKKIKIEDDKRKLSPPANATKQDPLKLNLPASQPHLALLKSRETLSNAPAQPHNSTSSHLRSLEDEDDDSSDDAPPKKPVWAKSPAGVALRTVPLPQPVTSAPLLKSTQRFDSSRNPAASVPATIPRPIPQRPLMLSVAPVIDRTLNQPPPPRSFLKSAEPLARPPTRPKAVVVAGEDKLEVLDKKRRFQTPGPAALPKKKKKHSSTASTAPLPSNFLPAIPNLLPPLPACFTAQGVEIAPLPPLPPPPPVQAPRTKRRPSRTVTAVDKLSFRRTGNSPSVLRQPPPSPSLSLVPLEVAEPPSRPSTSSPKRPAAKHEVGYSEDRTSWVPADSLGLVKGKPPLWAEWRQELCESLDYYKSYQGGHYVSRGLTRGYLLDGFPSILDGAHAQGKVIISHGGGCSESTPQGYVLKSNQTANNSRVKALRNCHETGTPVALLAGAKWESFPRLRELGVRYAVLGWYRVTCCWTEWEPNLRPGKAGQGFSRCKFRFEWVASQGEPWFTQFIVSADPRANLDGEVDELDGDEWSEQDWGPSPPCEVCGHSVNLNPFEQRISCLNPDCTNFFLLDGVKADPRELSYRRSFLVPREPVDAERRVPMRLKPESLQAAQRKDSSRSAWNGFVCDECGKLSSRTHWDHLECSNCGATADAMPAETPPPRIVSRSGAIIPRGSFVGLAAINDPINAIAGTTYILDSNSRVHHFHSTDAGGMLEIARLWSEFQSRETGAFLRRNPLRRSKAGGRQLTGQFGFNAGERYRYVVDVGQFPFRLREGDDVRLGGDGEESAEAPECVRDTLELAKNFSRLLVMAERKNHADDLNEVLTIGYFAEQDMGWHHDGEDGLGQIVSAFSLGSPATLAFRRRKMPEQPVPEGKRKAKSHPIALKLTLLHGDWLVMEGEVQTWWEHCAAVLPAAEGDPPVKRFVATSRTISDSHDALSGKRGHTSAPGSINKSGGRTTPPGWDPKQRVMTPDRGGGYDGYEDEDGQEEDQLDSDP